MSTVAAADSLRERTFGVSVPNDQPSLSEFEQSVSPSDRLCLLGGVVKRDLTIDDFFTGLVAALVEKDVAAVSIRGEAFYRSIAIAYRRLVAVASDYAVDPRFVIIVDSLHGDSPAVREAVSGVVLRDLASLDNPEYQDLRFKMSSHEAAQLLDEIPGGAPMFAEVARAFLDSYPFVAV